MLATVGTSRSIGASLNYNENEKKGGEIILSSGIDPKMPVKTQIIYLENMSNPKYKVKGHTIVLSHGKKDSQNLTPKQEISLLKSFLLNLERRGVNLDTAPWIAARHGNTKCTHYHIFISNTCFDGSRFKSEFLGKRACRAAADVSLQFGLEVPKNGARAVKNSSFQIRSDGKVEIAPSTIDRLKMAGKKKVDRQKAIQLANDRKEKYAELKGIIVERCMGVTKAGVLAKAEAIFLSKEFKHLYNDMSAERLYYLCSAQSNRACGYSFIRNGECYEICKDSRFVDYEHLPRAEAEKIFTERKNEMLGMINRHGKDRFVRELSRGNIASVSSQLLLNFALHPELFILEMLLKIQIMVVDDILNSMNGKILNIGKSLQNDRGMCL